MRWRGDDLFLFAFGLEPGVVIGAESNKGKPLVLLPLLMMNYIIRPD
jgi:hypothetical protein